MTMADVLTVVFLFVGLFLALPSYWLLARSLWPRLHEGTARAYREIPVRTGFVGLGATLAMVAVGAVLGKVAPALGLFFAGGCLGLALAGAGGLATRIGEGLRAPADDGRDWRLTLKGGVSLELAFLIPVLGWFLILPIALVSGVGAAAVALVRRAPEAVAHAAVAA